MDGAMPKVKSETSSEVKENSRENRLFRRRSVLWPAKILIGKHTLTCQVWNLSLGGARVRIDLPIQEGTELVLSVSGRGDIKSTVAWSKDGSLGLDFLVSADTIKRMFADRLHVLGLDAEE